MRYLSGITVFLFVTFLFGYTTQEEGDKCKKIDYQKHYDAVKVVGMRLVQLNAHIIDGEVEFDGYDEPYNPYHQLYIDLDDDNKTKDVYHGNNVVLSDEGRGDNGLDLTWDLIETDYEDYAIYYYCTKTKPHKDIVQVMVPRPELASYIQYAELKAHKYGFTQIPKTYDHDCSKIELEKH